MKGKTEQTPNGLATYSSNDFRTYPMEPNRKHDGTIVMNADGSEQWFQLCESYEGGRWEGFVSLRRVWS